MKLLKKNFCDLCPLTYRISSFKEVVKRKIKDFLEKVPFASEITSDKLDILITSHSSNVIKRGKGIDITLQENKASNIMIANKKINGILIKPGEVFSFWNRVGSISKRKGYKEGRVIIQNKIQPGKGGGLCNLANTINLLILHSPLDIIELHKHSDALAPDEGPRIPFANGTSVSYNYIDYRFKNNTDQNFQLFVWIDDEKLCGELRSDKENEFSYSLSEEGHCFKNEGDKYYRVSKIYRNIIEKKSNVLVEKKLIWDNHSVVMYDSQLISKELIK